MSGHQLADILSANKNLHLWASMRHDRDIGAVLDFSLSASMRHIRTICHTKANNTKKFEGKPSAIYNLNSLSRGLCFLGGLHFLGLRFLGGLHFLGGLRFWVLGLRSSFSRQPLY